MTPSNRRTKRVFRAYAPPTYSDCLCGSGKKFKFCCAPHLPAEPGSRSLEALRQENYDDALIACRAEISQYTIWHRSHTEPAVREGIAAIGRLLEIDISALSELTETLYWCYHHTGQSSDFPAALERLRANIDDSRWQRRIIYFHALHALGPDWDEDAGRHELRKLGSIAPTDDIETLQLYLDLFSDELSFSDKHELIGRIIREAKKASDKLHYRGTNAVLHLVIGDTRKAEIELQTAIDEFRAETSERSLNTYEKHRLSMTLELLGSIRDDKKLIDDAISRLTSLLKEGELTPQGEADVLKQIGDAQRHKGEWQLARDTYCKALELRPDAMCKVFLSECLLQLGNVRETRELLTQIEADTLRNGEDVDYAFALAALAIEDKDDELFRSAVARLKKLDRLEPYFQARRDAILVCILEIQSSDAPNTVLLKARKLLAHMFRSAISYLILKPSFMGIGIDVGKILEDVARGRTGHLSASSEKDLTSGQKPTPADDKRISGQ